MGTKRTFTDHERAVIVAEAAIYGTNVTVEKYAISKANLSSWRRKYREDPEFHALVTDIHARVYEKWTDHAGAFLVKGFSTLSRLLDDAQGTADIHTVAGAIKIAGNVMVAAQALARPDPKREAKKNEIPEYEAGGLGHIEHVPTNGVAKTVGRLGGQGGPPNGGRKGGGSQSGGEA